MNPITYIKDTIAELKAVEWPNRQTTLRLTALVISLSFGVGAYVGALDFTFTNLLKMIFG